jgi:hypothetical protein
VASQNDGPSLLSGCWTRRTYKSNAMLPPTATRCDRLYVADIRLMTRRCTHSLHYRRRSRHGRAIFVVNKSATAFIGALLILICGGCAAKRTSSREASGSLSIQVDRGVRHLKQVSATLLAVALYGCDFAPELLAVHGRPGDPTIVKVTLPCEVPLPPVAEFRWTGPAEGLTERPDLACEMVGQLKHYMDTLRYEPPEIDTGRPPYIEPDDWGRVRYVTFSPHRPPPPRKGEQRRTTSPQFELCADVRQRPRRFCVVMSEAGDIRPRFYHSHR